MIETLNGHKVKIVGDPHLGRRFLHGVPLHRRGEREEMVWRDFEESLILDEDVSFHIVMGDLFDKAVVPYDVILRASYLYWEACKRHPNAQFIVLRGNHDFSRDLEKSSAFDVFSVMMGSFPRVHALSVPKVFPEIKSVFIPWMLDQDGSELEFEGCEFAFGHWDVDSFGSDDANVVPTTPLAEKGIKRIYTGHVHRPNRFIRDGVEVVVTGSMQPLAFGEEVDSELYVTVTLDQIDDLDLKNKVVRVLLNPGETLDREIDCLQLVVKRLEDGEDGEPDLDVTLGNFSMEDLFRRAFVEVGAPEGKLQQVIDRYTEMKLGE